MNIRDVISGLVRRTRGEKHAAVEEPLRAELLSVEQLKRFAQALAKEHAIDLGPGYNMLLPRLADNACALRDAHQVLVDAEVDGKRMAPPAVWLLDNFYLIEQQIQLARIHLPKQYSRLLPRLANGSMKGYPRVYGMAFELIAHLDGLLDEESSTAFVAAYQTVAPLRLGELWAFPIALRLGLIENLRRVSVHVANRRLEKNKAIHWAEKVQAAAENEPKLLIRVLADFADSYPKLSAPFLEEFVERLQGQGTGVNFILNWVDQSLAEESTTVAQRLQADSHVQAAEHLSISNSIGSLRFLSAMNWKDFVEAQSRVEQILSRDPMQTHAMQDFATRDHYRHVIEELALRSRRPETEVAQMALEMAAAVSPGEDDACRRRHIGFYLIGRGRSLFRRAVGCRCSLSHFCLRMMRRCRLAIFLVSVAVGSIFFSLLPAWFSGLPFWSITFWIVVVVALIPASTLSISLVNFLVTVDVPPHPLPRLDFTDGIPCGYRTMVVVPTLITNAGTITELVSAMEIRYLGNRDSQLHFALLTDFPDADQEMLPGDNCLLKLAQEAIAHLNSRYVREGNGSTFYLLHRPRVWNPYERCWMGYERKRGKLEQFNALLRGSPRESFSLIVGDTSVFESIKYVITLDTDTDLPRGSACRMIGALAHPLNHPRYDEKKGRITDGYAILQPRASIRLGAASRSIFSRLSCGQTGLDPYSREVSDVYQDLFGEGSFVGKGIYDVDAFRKALDGRFPENLILSHDLLESAYARSALLGCVEVYEDTPSTYLGDVSRQHRWMRGDWQIMRWLGSRPPCVDGRRQRISLLSQWKIFDNLRRCFFAPVLAGLLIIGWSVEPVSAIGWTAFAFAVFGFTTVLRTMTLLLRKPSERGLRLHLRSWGASLARQLAQPLLGLSFLPYEATVALGAFACSAVRMPFTKRRLLIWNLPKYKRMNGRSTVLGFIAEMWVGPLVAFVAVALISSFRPSSLQAAFPLVALWFVSPLTAWFISRPRRRKVAELSSAQRRMLRVLACRTWSFFERFTCQDDNWLPPDNFQETPEPVIASRTSPTNIGFALLSNLTAWDFGYISTVMLVERTEKTLASMESLERYRGHYYNWYDTRSLKPLQPLYVSSVDSGNLAGSLIALRTGLLEVCSCAALPSQLWRGLRDTLDLIVDECGAVASTAVLEVLSDAELLLVAPPMDVIGIRERLLAFQQTVMRLKSLSGESSEVVCDWVDLLERQCGDHLDAVSLLSRDSMHPGTTLHQLARGELDDVGPLGTAAEFVHRLEALAERAQELQSAMDFRFLYNGTRELLSIGFDLFSRRQDPACYDLLASESRIASFLLIAGEQASPDHWFALGRLLTGHGSDAALLSWSGSMFEYLMPALLMAHAPDTLLTQTCRAAIKRQIDYGRQRRIPWGISESCYNARDAHHTYQYRAFGVPGMGLKRGLSDDLVVAPYATLLSLTFLPEEATENIQRLISHEGALGRYGLVEAIDYTPSRVPRGKPRAVVHSYMSHHQGMGFVALSHFLLDAPMVRRFMSDPAVKATEVLLQERVPEVSPAIQPHMHEAASGTEQTEVDAEATMRVFQDIDAPVPEVHLLSNGAYHVMVTHTGGSYSRWHDLALTRWREDATCDNWGAFAYIRDVDDNVVWSNTFQPVRRKADFYEAVFTQGRAEYRRRDVNIETHTEICVSPEADVEIRRIKLTNHSRRERTLEFTSFSEVVMAPLAADLAHRAFSGIFVRTEILPAIHTILCTRRRRSEDEPEVWMFHLLAPQGHHGRLSFETDRDKFVGRGRSPSNPIVLQQSAGVSNDLSNSEGSVLDPITAIRCLFTVSDDVPAEFNLITGAAETRVEALALAAKYRDRHFVERAFDMSWSHSQIVMRLLNVSELEAQLYGRLAGSVVFATPRNRVSSKVIAANELGQQSLWRFGISGDLPVVLLRIGDLAHLDLVTEALRAHAYWRLKGLASDLVIVNEDFSGYRATLNDSIIAAINASPDAALMDKPGGIFLRRIENLSEEDQVLFQSAARVVLTDTSETLREQVERRYVPRRLPPLLEINEEVLVPAPLPLPPRKRILENGVGGFSPDGREYLILLEPGVSTPAPWVNVIASPYAGMVVSESGSMYTWVENAHEFRLTPWSNDAVSDPTGEAYYLRDNDTGRFWSVTPAPAPGSSGYVCRHGFGYTVFEHNEAGVYSEAWVYVAMDAPVKFVTVKIRNDSGKSRNLSLFSYNELVLGEWRHANLMHIHTSIDSLSGLFVARNPFNRVFQKRVVFASCSGPDVVVSGNRTEFLGRNGTMASPAALKRVRLSGRTGAGLDPAAALQTTFDLLAGEEREIVFTIGAASDLDEARRLTQRFSGKEGANSALDAVWKHWNRLLGSVYVEVPGYPALSVMANGWLAYQTLSCRIWGRSGFYQSGGAYGFRDQLQDAMALLHVAPEVLREQILLCASRQFREGDVQHWWHSPSGAGVRTKFSDDLLWLPHAVSRYVLATGDTGVLNEKVAFLEGRALAEGEESQYEQHAHSSEMAPLYEHCVRAIKHSMKFGVHGLPLIGCGDWNDGMNRIGMGGRGESVWLAWFLCDNLRSFRQVAALHGEENFANFCRREEDELRTRTESTAWDGEWYRRAYFDDGTPLGSTENEECRIDSLSQSWAVISGAANPDRARRAMAAVEEQLVREDDALILLFTPPFDKTTLDPGYIKGYPVGVRENGGQYTHGAIWTAMAFALMGEHDLAWKLFYMLNPVRHGDSPAAIAKYRVEPYVMTADLYGSPPHTGRGGWSWYTGAAGWMYRFSIETLLGLERRPDHLLFNPRLSAHGVQEFTLNYRFIENFYKVTVKHTLGATQSKVVMDGVERPDGRIPLLDDKCDHQVTVFTP